jgi:rod shape determining protein RodA
MVGKEYDCSQNKKSTSSTGERRSKKPDDYNVKQSKIAIGSGGFWGRGFLKGTQTRGKYVPAQHTDFIFTSLGEAFGFVGTFIFLSLYLFFLFRLVRIAERQRSAFSRVYAYSVVGIFFFHIAVNISMTIGLFPVVGIPLPLISYGGSSLLTFTALLFILLRLDADRQMVLR